MFSGIIEEIGVVREFAHDGDGARLTVEAETVLGGTAPGDSIAVDGVCLTATRCGEDSFDCEMSNETLSRTHFRSLAPGGHLNLERSVAAGGRMGGHFVQGHVNGTGTIREVWPDGDSLWMRVEAPPEILRYVVPKGYIAIDGISLTVVEAADDSFTFMLAPFTQEHVTLPRKRPGDLVNLEVDILGKYVEKYLVNLNAGNGLEESR